MTLPPPPGLNVSTPPAAREPQKLSTQPHSSLPPRPEPAAGLQVPFKSTLSSSLPSAAGAPGTVSFSSSSHVSTPASAFSGFKPRQIAGTAPGWSSHSPPVSAPIAPPSGFPSHAGYSATNYQGQQYAQPQRQTVYQQPAQDSLNTASLPQIRNPFPLPGHENGAGYGRGRGAGRFSEAPLDPEMESQIAQWQSAYANNDSSENQTYRGSGRVSRTAMGFEGAGSASGANAGPLGSRPDPASHSMSTSAVASAADGDTGVAAVVNGADGKQKTVVRSGGGQTWTDSSLLEWNPAHFRLFVGNLAGEVTDESLLKAFSRYGSVQKARVVRDKRSSKSKGYGFVSFSDGDDYFQAAREMQGKYIGSHPILLRRSTTEIRPVAPGDKKGGKYGKGGKGSKHSGGGGNGGQGAQTGAGVQKKSSKTKGGLRVIG
ncbi:MAG: hypothetical protein M1825_001688 [Sarcosagium campestre]|nr:MAG: hypothetical protein M1825_001688 [Sarcosagium campestre]